LINPIVRINIFCNLSKVQTKIGIIKFFRNNYPLQGQKNS
jgi:hypothetical protein